MAHVSVQVDDSEFLAGVPIAINELLGLAADYVVETGQGVRARAEQLAPEHLGTLKRSIYCSDLQRDARYLFVEVGTDDPVGFYQEFGTRKMRAHPFMRPALAEERGVSFTGGRTSLSGSKLSRALTKQARARQGVRRAAVKAKRVRTT